MQIPILRDIVFRKVFAEEKTSEPILRALLNAILDLRGENRIISLEINDPHQLDNFDGKNSVLDIKATDERGRRYNIEVQLLRHPNLAERCLYYWSRLYCENFKKKSLYSELRRTVVIAIVDYPLEKTYLHNIYRVRSILDHQDFSQHLEIHTLDLTKFDKPEPGSLQTALEKWLHFLKYSLYYQEVGSPRPPELVDEEGIDQAMTSYQRASSSREVRARIERQEKAEHDRLSFEAEALAVAQEKGHLQGLAQGHLEGKLAGHLEGKLEGKLEAQRESAIQAISLGLTLEQAAAITGLSIEQVQQLAK